jgi:hypothetical protein
VALFEHYGSSELVVVNIHNGDIKKIGPKRLYRCDDACHPVDPHELTPGTSDQ